MGGTTLGVGIVTENAVATVQFTENGATTSDRHSLLDRPGGNPGCAAESEQM